MSTKARKKILAILGSTRKHSSNETILNFIANKYKSIMELEIYNEIDQLPFFNPDTEDNLISNEVCNFRSLIENSDGVIICTPEYVFSIPGVLKNALEWTVSTTVFSDKPVAVIVASGLGEKAFESLLLIMHTIQAKTDESTSLLINGARSKISNTGMLTDELTIKEIDNLI
ncbi:MAG TPA: NADPH-dependent FMN reductase, partial [Saprospiraceae bacterium]|nr:NADPH-dependent FMN reductase [Saprospiraceae bacterium]